MRLRPRSVLAISALAALSVMTAACGNDGYGSSTTTSTALAQPSTTGATEPASGEIAVTLTETDLGQILTTSEGVTLYTFEPDNGGASTCNGGCATTWPPLVSNGGTNVGNGLDNLMFATAKRDDGDAQVTVGGWPLYTFAGDAAPGDTNGQGVGGVWYVVGADGKAIVSSGRSTPTTSTYSR